MSQFIIKEWDIFGCQSSVMKLLNLVGAMQKCFCNLAVSSGCVDPPTSERILILGFYDRSNAGDELYKDAISNILGDCYEITFMCFDDIPANNPTSILVNVDTVICGGGDIINSYFMLKAQTLLSNFTGTVYAFSVGIPYEADAHFLHLFDHVFVRSTRDFTIACTEVGERNVTRIPDATFAVLGKGQGKHTDYIINRDENKYNIGVCLAQPAFDENPNAESIIDNIAHALHDIYRSKQCICNIHLIMFNYMESSHTECDLYVNTLLQKRLIALQVPSASIHIPRHLTAPLKIYQYMKQLNWVLCMRYHSFVFTYTLNIPCTVICCTPKMTGIMKDFQSPLITYYNADLDTQGRPSSIEANILYALYGRSISISSSNHQGNSRKHISYNIQHWLAARRAILFDKKKACVRINVHKNAPKTLAAALEKCAACIPQYLGISMADYDALLYRTGSLTCRPDFTRLLCYCLTGTLTSPYVWGLAANMQNSDFRLVDAISHIWGDFAGQLPMTSLYYPTLASNVGRPPFITLDDTVHEEYRDYHRSGWAYVVGGLMNLDADHFNRSSSLFVDTYVDRTFHWGLDAARITSAVPYKRRWIGFIHHTFDTKHSTYNCVELFKNTYFLESLMLCKGLVALTAYLAGDLRKALDAVGAKNVPVHVLMHPTEIVGQVFTMDKFLANRVRKVIQVGAWLRNPYAIYQLQLWKNTLKLQKCHLKGKEMDYVFMPPNFFERIEALFTIDEHSPSSQSNLNTVICRPASSEMSGICRPNVCKNQYINGLYNNISDNHQTVVILDRLSNDEYDELFSQNVVFLNLLDCSAVNTVIECIVRNTPLIVNRHPALEEMLGIEYPGFYEDTGLVDATLILNSEEKIRLIHLYMRSLDKSVFTLDAFMTAFCKVIEITAIEIT